MTREEAIKEIEKAFEPAFANYIITALTEGATVSDKALEQEPIINKIRAEIESLVRGELTPLVNVKRVLEIIDKYKGESEG